MGAAGMVVLQQLDVALASFLMDVLPQPQSLVTAAVASVVLGVLLQHEDFVALVSVFALADPPQHDDFAAVVAGALLLLAPPQQEDDDVGVTSGRFGSVFMFGSLGFVGPTSCRSGSDVTYEREGSCAPSRQRGHELLESLQAIGCDAVAGARSVDLALHEAGLLEHLEVLRHGRLRERHDLDDLAADAGAGLGQMPHDRDAGRVRQGAGHGGQLLVEGGHVVLGGRVHRASGVNRSS
jgi:hypothetical protein